MDTNNPLFFVYAMVFNILLYTSMCVLDYYHLLQPPWKWIPYYKEWRLPNDGHDLLYYRENKGNKSDKRSV